MKIILASGSPRRRELLQQIGLEFEVVVSDCEEVITATEPCKVVEELSLQKAMAVVKELTFSEDTLVIGADTVVTLNNRILGKPKNEADAIHTLENLQGATHQVYTGVSVLVMKNGDVTEQISFHESTKVTFCEMSMEEIVEYVKSGDCMDKAGSYGIQGFCARYIQRIEGDYNNVVGLPVSALYQKIKAYL